MEYCRLREQPLGERGILAESPPMESRPDLSAGVTVDRCGARTKKKARKITPGLERKTLQTLVGKSCGAVMLGDNSLCIVG